jgi:hypothetical protein
MEMEETASPDGLLLMKKGSECFEDLSMNGKTSNGYQYASVRPEPVEGLR